MNDKEELNFKKILKKLQIVKSIWKFMRSYIDILMLISHETNHIIR